MRFAVREMRKLTGMTLEELSEKSGVPTDTIFMMETNSVDSFNSKDICRIAKALKVSANSLFFDEPSNILDNMPLPELNN